MRVYQFRHPSRASPRGRGSGAEGSRTPDLLNAIQALSQLSYSPRNPTRIVKEHGTGRTGLEPATSGVTDRHSNRLSYRPLSRLKRRVSLVGRRPAARTAGSTLSTFGRSTPSRAGKGETRAGDRTRTGDLLHGKQTLYQLSYSRARVTESTEAVVTSQP